LGVGGALSKNSKILELPFERPKEILSAHQVTTCAAIANIPSE
jgi:hypothetical protein